MVCDAQGRRCRLAHRKCDGRSQRPPERDFIGLGYSVVPATPRPSNHSSRGQGQASLSAQDVGGIHWLTSDRRVGGAMVVIKE